jgi:hypothetical protein
MNLRVKLIHITGRTRQFSHRIIFGNFNVLLNKKWHLVVL